MRRIARQSHPSPPMFPGYRNPVLDLIVERRRAVLDPERGGTEGFGECLRCGADFCQTARVVEMRVALPEPGGADDEGPVFGVGGGGDVLD